MSVAIACNQMRLDNIKAIIFDKDGTLEDSLEFWRGVGIERARLIDAQIPGVGEPLLMAFGILDNTLNATGLMAVGSKLENEIAAAAYIAETGRSWHEARKIAQQAFAEVAESKYLVKNPQTAPLFSDVKATFATLANADIKIGILSADSSQEVENFIARHQLQQYIQLAMGTEGEIIKPDPQLFLQACENLKVNPTETLMVGDSIGDITMARSAGAAGTISICRHRNVPIAQASTQISNLEEIKVL